MALTTQIKQVRSAEARLAEENAALVRAMGIQAVYLQAAPGAGKTSLLLRTVESLGSRLRLAIVQAGLGRRGSRNPLSDLEIPVVWIETGGLPYLDANMLREALEQLPLADVDLLLIEEVGTLTSPAGRFIGETLRVILTSLPEGEDCPLRYPDLFARADAVVLNKLDLLPHLPFDRVAFQKAVRRLNRDAPILELSCRSGQGLEEWIDWLLGQVAALQA